MIAIDEEVQERLKWVKTLTVSDSYGEAIDKLIERSELEVPDEEFTEESFKRVVLGAGAD